MYKTLCDIKLSKENCNYQEEIRQLKAEIAKLKICLDESKQREEIARKGIAVDFNQGLDARRACDDPYILDLLSRVKWIRHIRFACDTRAQIEPVLKCIRELEQRGVNRHRFFVYCLVKEIDDALYRLNIFREMHINPFAQPYRDFDNKIRPTVEQRRVAHWCNKKSVFYSCEFKNFRL